MQKFQKFIEEPKNLLEVKVNLERAINDLRAYYNDMFIATIQKNGCSEESTRFYSNFHAMEAMHNIKCSIHDE